jgi:HK97 gp10 family phage protein
VLAKLRQAVQRGVARGVEAVHEEATSLILDTPKTGRIYRRRGVEHQASAPEESPASDTGRLVQSGRTEVRDVVDEDGSGSAVVGTVIWSTAYAEHLEHGTEKMEPRPFARPALAAKKNEIIADIAAEVRGALR